MKKIVSLFLIGMIILSLCGCGNVPDDLTKEGYKLGKEALKIMDNYLDDKIEQEEVEIELFNIMEAIDEEIAKNEDKVDERPELQMGLNFVSFAISSFMLGIYDYGSYDCEDARDFLAEALE